LSEETAEERKLAELEFAGIKKVVYRSGRSAGGKKRSLSVRNRRGLSRKFNKVRKLRNARVLKKRASLRNRRP
jgi:hypothetical protein